MTYQSKLKGAMTWISTQPKTVFIGEGLKNAGDIYGTLANVSSRSCLEMPISENLIVGTAIGLSMTGSRPIVVFQRMDFMLIAADAIINHLCLIPQMSGGQFTLPVIIRAIIGSQSRKFDMGEQHKHDFRHVFEPYMQVVSLAKGSNTLKIYKRAYNANHPVMIVEERDLYAK